MNIAIYGAGGVGGYYGGALAQAGHKVSLVARGAHLAAIRRTGLSVRSPGGDFHVRPAIATDDPGEIGRVDAVIVAVKSLHLPAVRDGIAPLLGPDTLVVPLLNGVDAHEALLPAVGSAQMGKGLTRIMSEVSAPGEIRHIGVDPYVALAEWDGGGSPRANALVAALRDAGVDAEVPPDIDAALWLKFLFVCSLGGVCAACRMHLGPVRTLPESRSLLRRAMEEIAAVAAAHGVSLSDDAVTRAMQVVDSFPAEGTSSLQRDLAAGVPSELDAWTGAAVRLGATVGVATPVHSFIHAVLLPSEMRARGQIEGAVAVVRRGLPFSSLDDVAGSVGIGRLALARVIGLSPTTMARRRKAGTLTSEESDGLVRVARLVAMAHEMMQGDEDAARRWLKEQHELLEGESPLERASTEVGGREVEELIGRLRHGTFS